MTGPDTVGGAERKPRVLLVEDHLDTRQMYAEFLRTDFEVLQAEDAATALTIMRADVPDIVVTDLSLPGMDGFELAERIRQEPAFAVVAIICLSGYGGHGHESRAREAGCDRVLLKPCMPDALADAVSALLRDTRSRSMKR